MPGDSDSDSDVGGGGGGGGDDSDDSDEGVADRSLGPTRGLDVYEKLHTNAPNVLKKDHGKGTSSPKKKSKKARGRGGRSMQIVCNLDHCQYPIVAQAARAQGWRIAKRGDAWDIAISDNNQAVKLLTKMTSHPRTLNPVQRINHFPNMKQLYRKDLLARNLNALQDALPSLPSIGPRTWNIPEDTGSLIRFLGRTRDASTTAGNHEATASSGKVGEEAIVTFIIKPAAGLQGQGIHLTANPLKNAASAKSGDRFRVGMFLDFVGRPGTTRAEGPHRAHVLSIINDRDHGGPA